MSHYQWSRRSSQHRASSKKRRRRRSVRSNSSCGMGFHEDENEILQMYGEDGELADVTDGPDEPQTLVERIKDQKDIMENVKFQPWPINKKLQVLSLARAVVVKHEGRLSRGRGYQQKGQQLLKKMKRSWNNFVYWMTPWEMRIKRIESHFGSVVASYFIFLRWLLWINLWLTVVQLCFVIVPEMLVGPDHWTTDRKTIPEDKRDTAYDLKTIWDAEGVMRYSPLFYGYYGNADIIGDGYRLPLAYLMTTLASFAYSFIVVLKKMASNSRQSRLSNKEEEFTFSWKLFSDWDFMVGNPETATTKHASIVTTMKEAIVEEQEKKQEENKYLIIFLRVLANVIIMMLLALSTYIIQLFVERSRELELAKLEDKDHSAGFWAENELTIIMTLISTIFPNVLDLISLMEKYHPRTSLRLQLARIFLLNLINLYTLFIALYNKQNDLKAITLEVASQMVRNASRCFNTSTSADVFTSTLAPAAATVDGGGHVVTLNCTTNGATVPVSFCWETMIGQEVFKLTLMDLIFVLGQIVIIDVLRGLFVKYCNHICCWDLQKKFPEYPEFKTAENLLHLINNQGVIWLGVFFSPGLAVLNLLKLLLLMYVRCWTVVVCNVPQERIFRASRSNNFYFALQLVMLFLCMLPPLFAIVGIDPSPTCGPFSGLDKIYHVLTRTMENELPASINSVLDYAVSPGVILPVFMLLGMTIYYLVSIGRSLRDANNELRMMLEYERTEGRKKVYAMADAKRDLSQPDGQKKTGNSKMAKAVSSMLKAAQMAKAIAGLEQKRKQGSSSGLGQKMAPAVQPKPHVPVAVVHGKRSLKRNAAAVKAALTRRQQNPVHRRGVAGTNGHMMVTTTSSLDTPEISSNDEDDLSNASNYSSRSSLHSTRPHDDPAAIVDDTGHLRPVTDDDVFLDMDSGSEEDESDEDDVTNNESANSVDRSESFAVTVPVKTAKEQQTTAKPPVRSGPSRASGKIQPAEIPRITVVDFGEEGVSGEQQNKDDASRVHVEPMVIVENENAKNKRKSGKKFGPRARTKVKTQRSGKTHRSDSDVTTPEYSSNDMLTEVKAGAKPSITDSSEQSSSGLVKRIASKNDSKAKSGGIDTDTQDTQGKSSKFKFSNILARFQRMDENG